MGISLSLIPRQLQQTLLRRPHFARIGKRSHHPDDPPEFWGWRWICPACKEPVKSIYFPVPVRMIFDNGTAVPAFDPFIDPVIEKNLSKADLPAQPPPTFACYKCHNIQYTPATSPVLAWNQYITYVTAGLLFGHEVPRPTDLLPQRHNTRIRQLNRAAPIRRKVLSRLSNGWSKDEIALHLGISVKAVKGHIHLLCREENVPNVHALAQKLNFAKPPPPTRAQLAQSRRPLVQEMLLANCGYYEIAHKLGVPLSTVKSYVNAIYRAHGLKARGSVATQRALADKLGLNYSSNGDELRSKAVELRENGLTLKQVAHELGISERSARWYGRKLTTQIEKQMPQPALVPEATTKV